MERALLEMGQFSQAYEQLLGWIEKTNHTLEEVCFWISFTVSSFSRSLKLDQFVLKHSQTILLEMFTDRSSTYEFEAGRN